MHSVRVANEESDQGGSRVEHATHSDYFEGAQALANACPIPVWVPTPWPASWPTPQYTLEWFPSGPSYLVRTLRLLRGGSVGVTLIGVVAGPGNRDEGEGEAVLDLPWPAKLAEHDDEIRAWVSLPLIQVTMRVRGAPRDDVLAGLHSLREVLRTRH